MTHKPHTPSKTTKKRFNGFYVRDGSQIETKPRRQDCRTEKLDHCSRAVSQSKRDEALEKTTPLTVEEYEKIRREAEAKEREKAKKLLKEYQDYESNLRKQAVEARLANRGAVEHPSVQA